MNAVPRMRPAREAWFVTGPGPDERLGSVVDRAASVYGTLGESLLDELLGEGDGTTRDVDGAGAADVAKIARAIGVAPRDLWRHRLNDHPSLLAPGVRRAYCPACWREDRAAGREPGFRRDWAGVLRTMCTRHGEPLRLEGPFARCSEGTSVGPSHRLAEDSDACLAAIEHFGRTLEGALYFGQPWPSDWAWSPQRARATLLAVSLNLRDEDAFPPVSQLVYPSSLAGNVRVPSHAVSPIRNEPWGAFRAIADPALRRAALWLVGWWTCPNWRDAWRPGWIGRHRESALGAEPVARLRGRGRRMKSASSV